MQHWTILGPLHLQASCDVCLWSPGLDQSRFVLIRETFIPNCRTSQQKAQWALTASTLLSTTNYDRTGKYSVHLNPEHRLQISRHRKDKQNRLLHLDTIDKLSWWLRSALHCWLCRYSRYRSKRIANRAWLPHGSTYLSCCTQIYPSLCRHSYPEETPHHPATGVKGLHKLGMARGILQTQTWLRLVGAFWGWISTIWCAMSVFDSYLSFGEAARVIYATSIPLRSDESILNQQWRSQSVCEPIVPDYLYWSVMNHICVPCPWSKWHLQK